MDVEKTYQIGYADQLPVRLAIGWSDTNQEHYARIETDTTTPETLRFYSPSTDEFSYSLSILLIHLQDEILEVTGMDNFVIPSEDLETLQTAPRQRLVDPSEIEELDMLDTDYAIAPIYGTIDISSANTTQQLTFEEFLRAIDYGRDTGLFADDAPIEDLEQTVQDCYAELQTCVSGIRDFIDAFQRANAAISKETLDNQCNREVNITATLLLELNQALHMSFPRVRIQEIGAASADDTAAIDQIYTPEELERINAVTTRLCGSKLTNFYRAAQRGYDPVTGLPLECPNPESFRWEDTVDDTAVSLYQHYGLSNEEARRAIEIQRTDPRFRTEEDWILLEETRTQLKLIAQGQESWDERNV